MGIKTIIFDFGGVILKMPSIKWINRWKKLLGFADEPEIIQLLDDPNGSQMVQDVCLGKTSEDEVWDQMAEKWNLNSKLICIMRRRVFSKCSLNKSLIKYIAELSKNYQTAILSNAGDQTRKILEETYKLDRLMDEIIISAEEGVIKPDPAIYQIAMERLNTLPEETLFVDDYMPNVLAAREFGMEAVQFINNQQTIQTIQDYLGTGG